MSEELCDLRTLELIRLKGIEFIPDAVIFINAQGAIIDVNAHAELLFGYAREDIVGQPVECLIPRDAAEAHVEHRNAYFREPMTREMGTSGMALRGKHRDGTVFSVQIKLGPLPIPGLGVFAMAVVRRVKDSGGVISRPRSPQKGPDVAD